MNPMKTLEYEKLTIYEVESFQKSLLERCRGASENVVLDFSPIHKVDMAGIQLLLSAQKMCIEKGISLIFHNVSSEVNASIQIAGCEALFGGNNG